ncbi:MAG: 1-acyl-sn-glycerol-3-phosphate acyltransferase [Actinomycetia bacterium]|nr:1-acyl-sn-glycerol-3-phosphate acyltransferase [Actinomycetes bacterium]
MKKPPPYLVRRLIIDPLFVVGAVAALTFLPLWLLVAAFASRFLPGRWRPLRVAWFLFLYVALEAVLLIALFVLWIGSGFGWKLKSPRFQAIHYTVAGWWLRRVMGSARRTFKLVIEPENTAEAADDDRPRLIFSRHAGPGDSFLLVDAVINGGGRRPRIILKDLLRLDPCVDVMLGRLPNRFIPSTGRAGTVVVDSIEELSTTMVGGDALVLFPEGGNFTPHRRQRAIEKLEEIGRPGLAAMARDMDHLLPPKPTGALTAIKAAPHADIVFVGHVGLEALSTTRDLWRGIPMDSHVISRVWVVSAEDVPAPDEQEEWLYDQWGTIDDWIDGHLSSSEDESNG